MVAVPKSNDKESRRCTHGCKATKMPAPSAGHMAMEYSRRRTDRPRCRTLTRRRGGRAESPPPAPVVADLAVGGDVQWSARGPPRRDSAHPVFSAPAATKVVDRQGKVEKRLLLCQSIRSIGAVALRRPTIGGSACTGHRWQPSRTPGSS